MSRRRLGRKEVAVSGGACKRAGALSHKAVERLRFGNIDGTRERILCPVLFNIRWTDIATCNGGGTGCSTNFIGSSVSSLQQIDQTENKPSTSKRLVVSYRALPQTPVRGSACGSSPTAACWTSQAVRNTGRTRLNAGRPPSYGNAGAVRDNGNERTPVGPGVPVAKTLRTLEGAGFPGEVHVPQ